MSGNSSLVGMIGIIALFFVGLFWGTTLGREAAMKDNRADAGTLEMNQD
ncbi:MAG: hypothetical protein ACK5M4_15050 [Pseudorhodobacter sp.]